MQRNGKAGAGIGIFGSISRYGRWTMASAAAVLAVSSPVAAQTGAAQPVAGQASQVPDLATFRSRDLKAAKRVLASWLPGTFDNHEQRVRQSGHALMPLLATPFRQYHVDIKRLSPEEADRPMFQMIAQQGDGTSTAFRNEVLTISEDVPANALRLQRYHVAGNEALKAPAKTEDMSYLGKECDLLLRFEGGQFVGSLASGQCKDRGGVAAFGMIVGQDYLWTREETRDRNGKLLWEAAPGTRFDWYQASRARFFSCDIFGDAEGVMENTKFVRTITLNDQGEIVEFPWIDGRTLAFTIHRRAFASSARHLYPLFRVHEKGNPVPIAYAYAEGNSDKFGLNLGWFYVRCAETQNTAKPS